jgi:hypothetical protein
LRARGTPRGSKCAIINPVLAGHGLHRIVSILTAEIKWGGLDNPARKSRVGRELGFVFDTDETGLVIQLFTRALGGTDEDDLPSFGVLADRPSSG